MSEVYQALDGRLGREVALKMLPAGLLEDGYYLARLEREARLVASLNHPNIAALYGVEGASGSPFLVLELVPGSTLAELLAGGPLPVGRSLEICRQIAEALEAAHASGVVHRDLKPANIKVTPDGRVKVLDFGLAKGLDLEAPEDPMRTSTATLGGLRFGTLLGTPSYMSPEQLRGRPVHTQIDVWSFGCVLYESLTGRRAFVADTLSDTIAAILGRDPDWQALPDGLPERIRSLLHRCLAKDPRHRLHDIADARVEIEEVLSGPTPPARRSLLARWRPRVLRVARWLAPALVLVSGSALVARSRPDARLASFARLDLNLPAASPIALDRQPALAVSRDASLLVYASQRGSGTQLYLRRLDQTDAVAIPGTEGGDTPFFSPDGEWIGFAAEGKLKKVALAGGTPLTLADAPALHGAAWGEDGRILFAPSSVSGLYRVDAAGGAAQALTVPDSTHGEGSHRWPELLPGGDVVLYTAQTAGSESLDDARIAALSLRTGHRRVVLDGGTFPRYAPTGHLVYARAGALLAAPFDRVKLEIMAPPVPVVDGVTVSPLSGAAQISFSADGMLVYAPGGTTQASRALLWVNRDGRSQPAAEARLAYSAPRLSPDGQRVALAIEDERGFDVWTHDLVRGTSTRLTADAGNEVLPLWTPNGARVAFGASPAGSPPTLFWRPSDGGGEARALPVTGHRQLPGSCSPDGQMLAVTTQEPAPGGTGYDIWLWPLRSGGKPQSYLSTPFDEAGPMFSPNGRWIAFTSNETGRDEIYVRPYPGPGGKWRISSEGGSEPVWSRDGGELFFRSGDQMMSATVTASGGFRAGRPTLLFEGPYDAGPSRHSNYDVAKDGRFLMVRSEQRPAPTQLHVVLSWFSDLRRRAPLTPR
jgi:serine/threonine protein kinase/Tol biopolymer transport system component